MILQLLQRLSRGCRSFHTVTLLLQNLEERALRAEIVVDYQNGCILHDANTEVASAGKVMYAAVPRPSAALMRKVPR